MTSAPSSISSSVSRPNTTPASMRRWRSPNGCARMSPRFETPIFYYRPYPGNPIADAARAGGYVFPRGLAGVGRFRLRRRSRALGERQPLASGRTLQVLHAPRLAAGRRGAGRCGRRRAGAAIAIATRSRSRRRSSSGCGRRSRCRDGSAPRTRAISWPTMPKSGGSCGRTRRSASSISPRT